MSALALRHLRLVAICSLCIAGTAAAAVLEDPVETRAKDKVTLCHAEGNGSWHSITIAPEAGLEGHDGHSRDIIPAFTYEKGGEVIEYPGKNMGGEGQVIYDKGCVAPDPPDPPDYPIGVFGSANCEEGRATYSVTFGYDSENKVPVSIPVGSNNFVSPGSRDRSQPTTLRTGPGRERVHGPEHPDRGHERQLDRDLRPRDAIRDRHGAVRLRRARRLRSPRRSTSSSRASTRGTRRTRRASGTRTRARDGVDRGRRRQTGSPPTPEGRGQPIAFEAGSDKSAVTVSGIPNGTNLVWTRDLEGHANGDRQRHVRDVVWHDARCHRPRR